MMKKKFLLIISAVCLFSCAEENITEKTCDYALTLQEGVSSDSEDLSAVITINTGKDFFRKTTDFPLNVSFDDLPSGTAVVTISCEGFCAVRYKIVLPENSYCSTTVKLLPFNDNAAAVLKGRLQTSDLLTVSEDLKVFATPVDSVEKFIEGGEIYDVHIENFSGNETSAVSGSYELTLPATMQGIKYVINADGFLREDSAFEFKTDTVTLFSGKTSVKNLVYTN